MKSSLYLVVYASVQALRLLSLLMTGIACLVYTSVRYQDTREDSTNTKASKPNRTESLNILIDLYGKKERLVSPDGTGQILRATSENGKPRLHSALSTSGRKQMTAHALASINPLGGGKHAAGVAALKVPQDSGSDS